MIFKVLRETTKREVKENKYLLRGYIKKTRKDDENLNYVELNDKRYVLMNKVHLKINRKMYMISENEYVISYTRVPFLLLLLIGVGVICSCMFAPDKVQDVANLIKPDLEQTDKIEYNLGLEIEKQIEIPAWGTQYLNKDNPYVYISNPKKNEVYFQYDIYEGNNKITSTKWIQPMEDGYGVPVDLHSLLSKGEHTLRFELHTYELQTQAPQNGANITVLVVNDK